MTTFNNKNSLTGNNAVANTTPKFSVAIKSEAYQDLINNTLRDKKIANEFVANISTVVANNPTLQECTPASIISSGLMATSLKLPMTQGLGYVYLVPFNDKRAGQKKAQFQVGYRGMVQLAIRSGQIKSIEVTEVRENELGEFDPLKGFTFNWNTDYKARKNLKVIGYVGYFKLINGFEKYLYIPYEEMLDHADKYSAAFNKESFKAIQDGRVDKSEMWKYSSFWYSQFDEMAKKTVLRQLLKYAPMSVEMEKAITYDQSVITNDGKPEYVDNVDLDNTDTMPFDDVEVVENEKEEQDFSKFINKKEEAPSL